MEKKNIVIYVAGQRFSISTTDSQEYVMGIGDKVDVMIKGISKDNPRLNRDACAILAALSLCDDEAKLRQMMEVLRTQVKDYLEANEKLREENLNLREQSKELTAAAPESKEIPCKESPAPCEVCTEVIEEETEGAPEAVSEEATIEDAPAPVAPLSRSEAIVMAQSSETSPRQTAFTGKDFRSGKKGKKNKKHNKPFVPQAPAAPVTAATDSTDTDDATDSPYHQFSIFDGLE